MGNDGLFFICTGEATVQFHRCGALIAERTIKVLENYILDQQTTCSKLSSLATSTLEEFTNSRAEDERIVLAARAANQCGMLDRVSCGDYKPAECAAVEIREDDQE
jgi:hypothetical protein